MGSDASERDDEGDHREEGAAFFEEQMKTDFYYYFQITYLYSKEKLYKILWAEKNFSH